MSNDSVPAAVDFSHDEGESSGLVSMCPGPGVVTVLTASRAVLRAEQAAAAEQLGGQAGQVPDLRGRRPPPLHPPSGHHHHP